MNQLVLEELTNRELIIHQRGYSRSFVHVRDEVDGILLGLSGSKERIRGQVYELGSDNGKCTKNEMVDLVQQHVEHAKVTHKDLSFGGDMWEAIVPFTKVRQPLEFEPKISLEHGILEVRDALEWNPG